jgi:transposase
LRRRFKHIQRNPSQLCIKIGNLIRPLVKITTKKALPILTQLKEWLDEASNKVIAGSYIGKAIKYNLNQWHKLIRYLEEGHLGIDNNITKRAIRPFTTGRENWLFSKSVNGAQASTIPYSHDVQGQ